jgi:hypothetical protein
MPYARLLRHTQKHIATEKQHMLDKPTTQPKKTSKQRNKLLPTKLPPSRLLASEMAPPRVHPSKLFHSGLFPARMPPSIPPPFEASSFEIGSFNFVSFQDPSLEAASFEAAACEAASLRTKSANHVTQNLKPGSLQKMIGKDIIKTFPRQSLNRPNHCYSPRRLHQRNLKTSRNDIRIGPPGSKAVQIEWGPGRGLSQDSLGPDFRPVLPSPSPGSNNFANGLIICFPG